MAEKKSKLKLREEYLEGLIDVVDNNPLRKAYHEYKVMMYAVAEKALRAVKLVSADVERLNAEKDASKKLDVKILETYVAMYEEIKIANNGDDGIVHVDSRIEKQAKENVDDIKQYLLDVKK